MKKEKDKKRSLMRVVSNNLYMLAHIFRATPTRIPVALLISAADSLVDFLCGTFILRHMINGAQAGKNLYEIFTLLIFVFAFRFIIWGLKNIQWCFLNPKYETKTNKYFLHKIYKKSQELELACFENPEFYNKFVKALGEATSRAQEMIWRITDIVFCLTSMASYSLLLFVIDPWLIFFALFPLTLAYFTRKANDADYDLGMKLIEENRKKNYTRRVFYLPDYAKELRLTDMYKVMYKRFRAAVDASVNHVKKYGKSIVAFSLAAAYLHEIVSTFGAMVYSLYRTILAPVGKRMLYGDCLVVLTSISELSWQLSWSMTCLLEFEKQSRYIENLRGYFEYEPKMKHGVGITPPEKSAEIEFKNVSFKYDGAENFALENFSMKIKPGEKIAIVGQNGAGKTTLTKLLLRLYDAQSGEIFLDGKNIKKYDLDKYRGYFGSVFQDYKIFSLSVADNVMQRPTDENDIQTVMSAIEKAGMKERVEKMPAEIQTTLTREFDDNGEVLSGGEAQKISIARIYAREFGAVILDEPTSALDPIAEYKMYENMMEACKGKTVVFISHRLSSASLADRVYMIENGKIIASGPHRELMRRGGKYAEMFALQAASYKRGGDDE